MNKCFDISVWKKETDEDTRKLLHTLQSLEIEVAIKEEKLAKMKKAYGNRELKWDFNLQKLASLETSTVTINKNCAEIQRLNETNVRDLEAQDARMMNMIDYIKALTITDHEHLEQTKEICRKEKARYNRQLQALSNLFAQKVAETKTVNEEKNRKKLERLDQELELMRAKTANLMLQKEGTRKELDDKIAKMQNMLAESKLQLEHKIKILNDRTRRVKKQRRKVSKAKEAIRNIGSSLKKLALLEKLGKNQTERTKFEKMIDKLDTSLAEETNLREILEEKNRVIKGKMLELNTLEERKHEDIQRKKAEFDLNHRNLDSEISVLMSELTSRQTEISELEKECEIVNLPKLNDSITVLEENIDRVKLEITVARNKGSNWVAAQSEEKLQNYSTNSSQSSMIDHSSRPTRRRLPICSTPNLNTSDRDNETVLKVFTPTPEKHPRLINDLTPILPKSQEPVVDPAPRNRSRMVRQAHQKLGFFDESRDTDISFCSTWSPLRKD